MRILPRYLYHFTSKENAKRILTEGLKATEQIFDETVKGSNVYMVDVQNFAKCWSKVKNESYSLQTCLILGQALKNESREVCCFRIPTDKLKSNVLIRNQRHLFNMDAVLPGTEILSKSSKYKLYQRNGQAIEYVGSTEVPEHIHDIEQTSSEILNKSVISMLKSIFKKCNEIKAFNN